MRTFAAVALSLAVCARTDASAVVDLTEASFDATTKLDSETPGSWFIKFYAPWCGHCKKMAPAWDELADKLAAQGSSVRIGNVDVTQNRGLGSRFNVRGFPTLVFFHEGKMYKFKGTRSVEAFEAFVGGAYANDTGDSVPQPMGTFGQIKEAFKELFQAIVALYKSQFVPAIVMTALAFCSGLAVGFATGLVAAPTPAPPKPRPSAGTAAPGTKED